MTFNLIKYRDTEMTKYTYCWVNQNNQTVSPFFDSETAATEWNTEKPEPSILDDAQAEDEAFEIIARKQT